MCLYLKYNFHLNSNRQMQLLQNAFIKEKNLKIIKKTEFDIFYSCTYKYPLLVVEKIDKNTGKIIGENYSKDETIQFPLKEDEYLPSEYMLTEQNYKDYMEYGGCYGQNAPSINHKTNINTYLDTFKLSNLTPREVTLNNGMWHILEIWSKNIVHSNLIGNIIIYTGSIPNKNNIKLNDSNINVPTHFFKIVTATDIENKNYIYIACFLIPNKKPAERIYKLYKYLISLKELSKLTSIDFFQIFKYYNNFNEQSIIQSLKRKIRIDIHLNDNKNLIKQIKAAIYYGNLIYSESLQELNMYWIKCKELQIDNNIHQLYYNLSKKRLARINDQNNNILQSLHINEKSKKKKIMTPSKKSHKKIIMDSPD